VALIGNAEHRNANCWANEHLTQFSGSKKQGALSFPQGEPCRCGSVCALGLTSHERCNLQAKTRLDSGMTRARYVKMKQRTQHVTLFVHKLMARSTAPLDETRKSGSGVRMQV
jgi:hypothetical protein